MSEYANFTIVDASRVKGDLLPNPVDATFQHGDNDVLQVDGRSHLHSLGLGTES